MQQKDIRNGYRKHAALSQFHRWFLIYENSLVPLATQLDLLAADIKLKSGLGEAKGHDDYANRMSQIPKTWRNAHFVKSFRVDVKSNGEAVINAGITYLNEGMKPGFTRSAELSYAVELGKGAPLLPKLQLVIINQNSEGTVPAFTSAYEENRLKSLLHYWLALIEDPVRNLDPFREILADGFLLNFTSGKITNFKDFEKWFRGPASAVAASTHVMSGFKNDDLVATFDFDWNGITPDGKDLTAKTRHTWTVTDDPKRRFAQIKQMDVEVIEPFAPQQGSPQTSWANETQ
jgi:hypothetical protein